MIIPNLEVGSIVRVAYTRLLVPADANLYYVYNQYVEIIHNDGYRVDWALVELIGAFKGKRQADGQFVRVGDAICSGAPSRVGGFSNYRLRATEMVRTGLLGFGPFPKNDRLTELMDMRQEQQNHGGQAAAQLWDCTSFGKELTALEIESSMWGVEQPSTDSPRGCFQVLAERTYGGEGQGYQLYRGSFHSLAAAQNYAQALMENTDYYTGYSWVQVADVFHGAVWSWDTDYATWTKVVQEDAGEGAKA